MTEEEISVPAQTPHRSAPLMWVDAMGRLAIAATHSTRLLRLREVPFSGMLQPEILTSCSGWSIRFWSQVHAFGAS